MNNWHNLPFDIDFAISRKTSKLFWMDFKIDSSSEKFKVAILSEDVECNLKMHGKIRQVKQAQIFATIRHWYSRVIIDIHVLDRKMEIEIAAEWYQNIIKTAFRTTIETAFRTMTEALCRTIVKTFLWNRVSNAI